MRRGRSERAREAHRSDWRMVREVFVAPTDEEAWELSYGGMMGRMMTDYFIPLLGAFDFHKFLIDERNPPADGVVTVGVLRPQQLVRRFAADRRREHREGVRRTSAASVTCCCSASTTPKRRSLPRHGAARMDLLANDVMPRVAHLTGD